MNPDLRIAAIAARQRGAFSLGQSEDAGFSSVMRRRRLDAGRWGRLQAHSFRIAGTPITFDTKLVGAQLSAGEESFLSHDSARFVWDAPGAPQAIEVSVPLTHRPRLRDALVHRPALVLPGDIVRHRGFVVASPALTVVQMAGRLDHDDLGLLVSNFLARRLTTPDRIRQRLHADGPTSRIGVRLLDLAPNGAGVTPACP